MTSVPPHAAEKPRGVVDDREVIGEVDLPTEDPDSASRLLVLVLKPHFLVLLLLRPGDARPGHLERIEDLVEPPFLESTLSRRMSSRTGLPVRFASRAMRAAVS